MSDKEQVSYFASNEENAPSKEMEILPRLQRLPSPKGSEDTFISDTLTPTDCHPEQTFITPRRQIKPETKSPEDYKWHETPKYLKEVMYQNKKFENSDPLLPTMRKERAVQFDKKDNLLSSQSFSNLNSESKQKSNEKIGRSRNHFRELLKQHDLISRPIDSSLKKMPSPISPNACSTIIKKDFKDFVKSPTNSPKTSNLSPKKKALLKAALEGETTFTFGSFDTVKKNSPKEKSAQEITTATVIESSDSSPSNESTSPKSSVNELRINIGDESFVERPRIERLQSSKKLEPLLLSPSVCMESQFFEKDVFETKERSQRAKETANQRISRMRPAPLVITSENSESNDVIITADEHQNETILPKLQIETEKEPPTEFGESKKFFNQKFQNGSEDLLKPTESFEKITDKHRKIAKLKKKLFELMKITENKMNTDLDNYLIHLYNFKFGLTNQSFGQNGINLIGKIIEYIEHAPTENMSAEILLSKMGYTNGDYLEDKQSIEKMFAKYCATGEIAEPLPEQCSHERHFRVVLKQKIEKCFEILGALEDQDGSLPMLSI